MLGFFPRQRGCFQSDLEDIDWHCQMLPPWCPWPRMVGHRQRCWEAAWNCSPHYACKTGTDRSQIKLAVLFLPKSKGPSKLAAQGKKTKTIDQSRLLKQQFFLFLFLFFRFLLFLQMKQKRLSFWMLYPVSFFLLQIGGRWMDCLLVTWSMGRCFVFLPKCSLREVYLHEMNCIVRKYKNCVVPLTVYVTR